MSEGVTFTAAALTVIVSLLAALAGAIVKLFKVLMAAKDAQLEDMKGQRDAYRAIADANMTAIEERLNAQRQARGHNDMEVLAPVEPEHHSPVTEGQQDTADLQTLRARHIAIEKEIKRLWSDQSKGVQ